mgnify:FL=1
MNYCQQIKNFAENRLISELMKIVNEVDDSIAHECPYSSLSIKNKPLSIKTLPAIISQGEYKVTFNATNKKDEEINFIEFLISIISSEKNSFG